MIAVTTLAADKLRKASINSEPMRDPVAQREVASPDGTREAVDPVLERLDPDSGRPPDVMEANQLCLSFGTKRVLTDVNMPFTRGSITALIGPTGSGKSTLLRTLNRMNDGVPGFERIGDVLLRRVQPLGPQAGPPGAPPQRRHALPAAQPLPHVDP